MFKWVGPIGPDDWVLLARANSPITLTSLEQARQYKVGAYKGDAIALALEEKGMAPVIVLRDQDNARKLLAGQIDLWATGDPAGRFFSASGRDFRVQDRAALQSGRTFSGVEQRGAG